MTASLRLFTGNNRGYRRLFAAGLINGIGDRFSSIAMLALVLHLTGSGMAVGISLGVRVLPYLFMAPLGGLLASRLPRKGIMMTVDFLRVPVALSLMLVDGKEMLWLVYAGGFVMAAGEAVYSPVRKSYIPLLAAPEDLLRINGLEQLLNGCVLILGAFTGGLVSFYFGPDLAFVMNAVSFLTAGLLIMGIPHGSSAAVRDNNNVVQSAQAGSTGSSLSLTAGPPRRRALRKLIAGSLVLQIVLCYELLVPIINGWDNVLISVYAIQVFRAGDSGVGAFYAALGIGLSLSFFAGRLLRTRLLAVALCGLLLEGVLLMAISNAGHFITVFLLYIVLSLAGGIGNASLDTLVMRETPAVLQPAVFGLLAAVSGTLLGLSMLTAGWLLDYVEPRMLGFAGGAGFAGIALLLGGYFLLQSSGNKLHQE
ncbi:MFS transporter [Paenibacillus sp. MMS20-IR301]|uniref:MFS transporter n=1 Tax=Paenibacillus sp. MMS20-IR301 TaxID=2895946 RepID=UPI0028E54872|nr:MFS transporter [Paenibacillus sp. MMS20-IR301]WNS41638.1 MFS transporter [Paenibacillus sp. MMS20-IR301]